MDKMSQSGWKFVNALARANQLLKAEEPEIGNTSESIYHDSKDDTSIDSGDEQ